MAARRQWIDVCAICGKRADTNVPPIPPSVEWVGVCMACNKASGISETYSAWRDAKIAADKAAERAAGAAFWKARGIEVGDRVRVFGSHMLFGRFAIHGVAKVGRGGAYVAAKGHPRLSPAGAERVAE
jgi:hypothetical protein